MKLIKPFRNCFLNNVTQGFKPGEHEAVDIAGPYGTFLVAPFKARIERIVQLEEFNEALYKEKAESGCGLLMISVDDPTYRVSYWHCINTFLVKVGDIVEAGQPVARMGNTGAVYGSGHFYSFEERESEKPGIPTKGVHAHISMGIGDGKAGTTKNVAITDYIDWTLPVQYDLLTAIRSALQSIGNLLKK